MIEHLRDEATLVRELAQTQLSETPSPSDATGAANPDLPLTCPDITLQAAKTRLKAQKRRSREHAAAPEQVQEHPEQAAGRPPQPGQLQRNPGSGRSRFSNSASRGSTFDGNASEASADSLSAYTVPNSSLHAEQQGGQTGTGIASVPALSGAARAPLSALALDVNDPITIASWLVWSDLLCLRMHTGSA